jgi:hypothetical protein
MTFFESFPVPDPAPPPRLPRRPGYARTRDPGSVPAELILARTKEAAIAVGTVRAYPNGFELTAHVRLRREPETGGLFVDPFELQRPGRNVPAGARYALAHGSCERGPPRNIGAPATRALTAAGYTELRQLADVPVADLKKLHGVGPKALRLLQEALEQHGMSLG